MFASIHRQKGLQLFLGFAIGICFGFLLQKGGATNYDVFMGQLLLMDFTILKIMISAVVTGMIGIQILKSLGLIELHIKQGAIGSTVIGALILGAGFALLGYCPGTAVGAMAQGWLDALTGVIGIIVGSGIFAALYAKLNSNVLSKGSFGSKTLPQILKINSWAVVIPVAAMLIGLLYAIESFTP